VLAGRPRIAELHEVNAHADSHSIRDQRGDPRRRVHRRRPLDTDAFVLPEGAVTRGARTARATRPAHPS
jgi:hypothetical protein